MQYDIIVHRVEHEFFNILFYLSHFNIEILYTIYAYLIE